MNNSNISTSAPTSVLKKEIEDMMLYGSESKLGILADKKGINTESLRKAVYRNARWLRSPEWTEQIKKIWGIPKSEVITEVVYE